MMANQHRAGDQQNGGNIGTGRSHQLRGHGFITPANQHDRIHGLRADHLLRVHGHQIAQEHGGRIGKTFMDRNGRKGHRQTTSQHDAAFHRLDQLRHIAVTGIVIAEGVGDADNRALQRIVRKAHGLDKGTPQKQ